MSQSPFPGMDLYLETPDIWGDFHGTLMHIFRDQLNEQITPKYVAEMQTQVVVETIEDDIERWGVEPDVAIVQPRTGADGVLVLEGAPPAPIRRKVPLDFPLRLVTLWIRRREDEKLVTVIELLSPVNKRRGRLRQEYLDKRAGYFEADVHFIEIDLLRSHPRMPLQGKLPRCDYIVMVSKYYERPNVEVWPIRTRQPLPVVSVPLVRPDTPASLDLGEALRTAYTRARYDLRINYDLPPVPPLFSEDAAWAATLIAKQRR